MFSNYYYDIEVYRKAGGPKKSPWGDSEGGPSPVPEIPFLVGYKYSHTIEGLSTPRASDEWLSSKPYARTDMDEKSMYCDVDADIRSGDVVVYTGESGKIEVYRVQGETYQDYMSPFTHFDGGKEVYLQRFTKGEVSNG